MANFGAKLVAWPTDQNDLAPQVRVMVIWAIPKYKCFSATRPKGGCEGQPEKFCPANTEKVSETCQGKETGEVPRCLVCAPAKPAKPANSGGGVAKWGEGQTR